MYACMLENTENDNEIQLMMFANEAELRTALQPLSLKQLENSLDRTTLLTIPSEDAESVIRDAINIRKRPQKIKEHLGE